jgi:hypothetical protein
LATQTPLVGMLHFLVNLAHRLHATLADRPENRSRLAVLRQTMLMLAEIGMVQGVYHGRNLSARRAIGARRFPGRPRLRMPIWQAADSHPIGSHSRTPTLLRRTDLATYLASRQLPLADHPHPRARSMVRRVIFRRPAGIRRMGMPPRLAPIALHKPHRFGGEIRKASLFATLAVSSSNFMVS